MGCWEAPGPVLYPTSAPCTLAAVRSWWGELGRSRVSCTRSRSPGPYAHALQPRGSPAASTCTEGSG